MIAAIDAENSSRAYGGDNASRDSTKGAEEEKQENSGSRKCPKDGIREARMKRYKNSCV